MDKHRPKNLSDLVVHSRKVAEVREWLEAKLHNVDKPRAGSCVLVLGGPAGVGKTTVVRVLVNLLGAELCEWDPPVPTVWKEHLHSLNSGLPYTSKLQEFEAFLEKVKQYPFLPLMTTMPHDVDNSFVQPPTPCTKQRVLLLDDLPTVHGRESGNQLCHCLHKLALSVQFPTVVVVTNFLECGENGQGTSRITAQIQQALESGGALKVMFNPITANAIKKVLTNIATAENCPVSSESLSNIAESSEGDIRHAVNSLQFLCLSPNSTQCTWDPGGVTCRMKKGKRRKVLVGTNRKEISVQGQECIVNTDYSCDRSILIMCRDGVLSLFHALGKLLYNKRHTDVAKESGEGIHLILKDHLQRHPLNMEAPESVLTQAHTEAGIFSSFLHENLLDFVDDDGIGDVAVSMSYLSDVDCLLGVKYKVSRYAARYALLDSEEIDPGQVAEATASSLAARGILFANTHPARHRWQSFRAPLLRQVERRLSEKKAELCLKSWAATMDSLSIVTRATQAIEYEPYKRKMSTLSSCTQFSASYVWRDASKPDTEISENKGERAGFLFQDQDLSSSLMTIDINRELDISLPGVADCDDEIEEW